MSRKQGRLTGERPRQGSTPASLLALHDAGYRAIRDRLGAGRVLDVGCGEGFESVRFSGPDRRVVGVDYSADATSAAALLGRDGLAVARMDAAALGLAAGSFDSVCSSHLIEHFYDPDRHVAELARVLAPSGTVFILTPNAPADFENPFHVHLFDRSSLTELLAASFDEVWVGGVDATATVKADFAARRAKAQRLLALDVFDLRHRIPRRWYVAAYTRLLPLAYRVTESRHRAALPATQTASAASPPSSASARVTTDDWFVTDTVDDTTMVLFAVCRRPRAAGGTEGRATDREPG